MLEMTVGVEALSTYLPSSRWKSGPSVFHWNGDFFL